MRGRRLGYSGPKRVQPESTRKRKLKRVTRAPKHERRARERRAAAAAERRNLQEFLG